MIARTQGGFYLFKNGLQSQYAVKYFREAVTGNTNMDADLLEKLDKFERQIGSKGTILNAIRSGSEGSAHFPGTTGCQAVDYRNLKVKIKKMYDTAIAVGFQGIGLYYSGTSGLPFIHLDIQVDVMKRGAPPFYWWRDEAANKYVYTNKHDAEKNYKAFAKKYEKELKEWL